MAYSTSNPPNMITTGVGSGPAMWVYASTDAHTDVDAANYFTNGRGLGMAVNDLVFVIDTDAPTATMHVVTAVGAAAASISVATLA